MQQFFIGFKTVAKMCVGSRFFKSFRGWKTECCLKMQRNFWQFKETADDDGDLWTFFTNPSKLCSKVDTIAVWNVWNKIESLLKLNNQLGVCHNRHEHKSNKNGKIFPKFILKLCDSKMHSEHPSSSCHKKISLRVSCVHKSCLQNMKRMTSWACVLLSNNIFISIHKTTSKYKLGVERLWQYYGNFDKFFIFGVI